MYAPHIFSFFLALSSSFFMHACVTSHAQEKQEQGAHRKKRRNIVVTSPLAEDVVSTRTYVGQIHARRHIEIRALERGYLEGVYVQEGQRVKRGELIFKIVPVLYQAYLNTELAEAKMARIRYKNSQVLTNKSAVSKQELALAKTEMASAEARVEQLRAELAFTALLAPFDGIVDRQLQQKGSLVAEGDVLSTLSDNTVVWVYFNVPEARYFEYKTRLDRKADGFEVELQLADGTVFPYPGKIGAIEADFDNRTGNVAFRADFPNPGGLLHHGQTGTILVRRKLHDAIVIPKRATYEILAKKFVYVVEPETEEGAQHTSRKIMRGGRILADERLRDKHTVRRGIVRQREIVILKKMDDIYLIKKGLSAKDKIVFTGLRQVRDGDKVDYELRPPEEILGSMKYHAE